MTNERFAQEIVALTDTLYRVSYSILPEKCDREDAVQSCLEKAWKRRRALREERYLKTWLVRILINECHNVYRRQRRYVPLADQPEPSASPPDVDLYLTLMNLPSMDRILLELHYVERMSEKEIALVYHLPASTIRGRIHRAKKKLRKELDV